jgi:AraC family transcriptional regulator
MLISTTAICEESRYQNGGNVVRVDHPVTMSIGAELVLPTATVQVTRFEVIRPAEHAFLRQEEDAYYLDLAITPRPPNTRLCFEARWGPHRFEAPGRLFLVPPGEMLKARCDRGSQISIVCLLKKNLFHNWLAQEFEWTERVLKASLNISNEIIQCRLTRLAEEARSPGFASIPLAEAMALQIVVELGRHYHLICDMPVVGGLSAWRQRLVDERLSDVLTPPTLAELAGLCGLSVRHLTRAFRTSRGYTIGEHIMRAQIEKAKSLLGAGESVKSVSFSMGFSSPSGFCCAFRRATGRTPRQYRMSMVKMASASSR